MVISRIHCTHGCTHAPRTAVLIFSLVITTLLGFAGCSAITETENSSVNAPYVTPLASGVAQKTSGPSNCNGNDLCYTLNVTCADVAETATAQLRVSTNTSTNSGTIVATSGGQGKKFYSDGFPELQRLLGELQDAGFLTVELSWPDGWATGSGEGLVLLACRVASAMQWIQHNLHDTGTAFCATGNSGGGVQHMYTLSHYGMETNLNAMIATAGPQASRIDYLCGLSPARDTELQSSMKTMIDASYGFAADGSGPCSQADDSFLERFLQDSIVSDSGDYNYATSLQFIYGELDSTGSTGQAEILRQHLSEVSDTRIQSSTISDVGHILAASPQGADAIGAALLQECKLP